MDVGCHYGEGGGDMEARGRLGEQRSRLAVQIDDKALSRVLRNRGHGHGHRHGHGHHGQGMGAGMCIRMRIMHMVTHMNKRTHMRMCISRTHRAEAERQRDDAKGDGGHASPRA